MRGPCRHCGVLVDDVDLDPFCCAGCRVAHAVIVDAGLERYYALADAALPSGRVLDSASARASAHADRPWLDAVWANDAPQTRRIAVDVQGISCAACVWVIEKLADRRHVACDVNPGVGRVDVACDAGRDAVEAFFDDVEQLGYRLGPPQKKPDALADDLLVRAGVCCALAMNAMIFAFSRYFGLTSDGGDVAHWFQIGEAVIATASVAVGGSYFIKTALFALKRGVLHLDLPIALGITLAYTSSVLSALFASTERAYFDTVSVFIALMLLGRLAQRRLLARSRSLLLDDQGIDGLVVRTLSVDGAVRTAPASSIRAGDRILVAPKEIVPVAARLPLSISLSIGDDDDAEQTTAPFSLSWITGEADEREFHDGDVVPAGAHSAGTRAVIVEAMEDMAASSLHALLAQRARDADDNGSPFWRRYVTASVFAVLALAAATFALWLHAGPVRALEVTTGVLVVTCPCAIGLAVPLAQELAAARLRRRGVYLRRAGVLDRLLLVKHVVLDKTGTLTIAALTVDARTYTALTALSAADRNTLYNLVARSSHPKSRALSHALLRIDPALKLDANVAVDEVPGRGVFVHDDEGTSFAHDVFTRDHCALLTAHFDEALQRDARDEVRALRARALDVHLASGDSATRVADVAARLDISLAHAHAAMSPDDKAALVEQLGATSVLVVGDGVNDAPAFAKAGVAGTPALDRPQLPARADFVYVGNGVGPLSSLFDTALDLRRASITAIAFAAAYNALAVTLAMTAVMTPLLCAVLMPASSLVVVALVSLSMSSTKEPTDERTASHALRQRRPDPRLDGRVLRERAPTRS